MSVKYDLIGKDYNVMRTTDPFMSAQLLSFLKPYEDGFYADFGCGTGNYTNAFHEKGWQYI